MMIARDYQFPFSVHSVGHAWWFSGHAILTIIKNNKKLIILAPSYITVCSNPHNGIYFNRIDEIRDFVLKVPIHANPQAYKNFVIGWLPLKFKGRLVLSNKDAKLSNPIPTRTQYPVWQWFAPTPSEYQKHSMLEKLKGGTIDYTIYFEDIYGS